MPTLIAAVVVASPTRRSAALNAYVSTEKLGQRKGERFVARSGINGCIPEYAERQMRDARRRWGKDGTRKVKNQHGKSVTEGEYVQAYHVIQSFARDGAGGLDPRDPRAREEAHELGVQLARSLAGRGRLATVTTQIDGRTGCIHNHLVIDSVDKVTGASFDSSLVKHSELVARNDRTLAEAGYEQINELGKGRDRLERSELRGLAKYRSWEADKRGPEPFSVAVLKQRVRDSLADVTFTGWDAFANVALSHRVLVERRGERGRGITYTMLRDRDAAGDETLPVATSDRRRASRLGTDFTMAAIDSAIERNRGTAARQTVMAAPVQAALDTALAAYAGVNNAELDEILAEERDGRRRLADTHQDSDVVAHRTPSVHVAESVVAEPLAPTAAAAGAGPSTSPAEAQPAYDTRRMQDPLRETSRPLEEADGPEASEAPAFRSKLRAVRAATASGQRRIDNLAQFDEDAVQVLAAGGRLDEESLRQHSMGPRTLAQYGTWLNPDLLDELERRQEKVTRATTLFEAGRIEEARQLREQIRTGDYSVDSPRRPRDRRAVPEVEALYGRHPELRPGNSATPREGLELA